MKSNGLKLDKNGGKNGMFKRLLMGVVTVLVAGCFMFLTITTIEQKQHHEPIKEQYPFTIKSITIGDKTTYETKNHAITIQFTDEILTNDRPKIMETVYVSFDERKPLAVATK